MQCFRETGWKSPHFCQKAMGNSALSPISRRTHFRDFIISSQWQHCPFIISFIWFISMRFSNSLSELARGYPRTFVLFSAAFLYSSSIANLYSRAFPCSHQQKRGNFHPFLWSTAILFISSKILIIFYHIIPLIVIFKFLWQSLSDNFRKRVKCHLQRPGVFENALFRKARKDTPLCWR